MNIVINTDIFDMEINIVIIFLAILPSPKPEYIKQLDVETKSDFSQFMKGTNRTEIV